MENLGLLKPQAGFYTIFLLSNPDIIYEDTLFIKNEAV